MLNVSYSVWFNRRHQRRGHLLQGRFKSVAVSREEWGLELSRYIDFSPDGEMLARCAGNGCWPTKRERFGPSTKSITRKFSP